MLDHHKSILTSDWSTLQLSQMTFAKIFRFPPGGCTGYIQQVNNISTTADHNSFLLNNENADVHWPLLTILTEDTINKSVPSI